MYREAFQLHQGVPTCSLALSDRYRASARTRIGRTAFGEPPAEPPRTHRRAPGWRSLVRLHPDLVAELHPTRNGDLDVAALAAASRRAVWWQCPACGHAWRHDCEPNPERQPLSGLLRPAACGRTEPRRSRAVARRSTPGPRRRAAPNAKSRSRPSCFKHGIDAEGVVALPGVRPHLAGARRQSHGRDRLPDLLAETTLTCRLAISR
jgi:hypothetical protein